MECVYVRSSPRESFQLCCLTHVNVVLALLCLYHSVRLQDHVRRVSVASDVIAHPICDRLWPVPTISCGSLKLQRSTCQLCYTRQCSPPATTSANVLDDDSIMCCKGARVCPSVVQLAAILAAVRARGTFRVFSAASFTGSGFCWL